jgi:hypothetical protein
MRMKTTMVVGVILTAGQASADVRTLRSLEFATGDCKQFVIHTGDDISSICEGRMIHTVYMDGRSGWMFYLKTRGHDGEAVTATTFTGPNAPEVGDDYQPVDGLISTYSSDKRGTEPTSRLPAQGTCRFSGPREELKVDCVAHFELGEFHVVFQAHGRPEVRNLSQGDNQLPRGFFGKGR